VKMTAPQSMKFSKLKRRLQLPHWQIVGLLESIWLFTQVNAPAGDIGRHSNEDIAAGIEWYGDADLLISHLVESGWLETCNTHRLLVHDWEDHAPNFLKGNMAKYGKSFARKDLVNQSPRDAPKESPREAPREAPSDGRMDAPPNVDKPSQSKTKEKTVATAPIDENAKNAICGPISAQIASEAVQIPESLSTAKFGAVWTEWVADRKARKKPVTARAMARQLKSLEPLGEELAIQCVIESIKNGWTGIFPEKYLKQNTNEIGGMKSKFRQRVDYVAGVLLNGVEHEPDGSVLALTPGGEQCPRQ